MIRLIFLSFLTHSLARINPTKLRNLGVKECDLVPGNRYGYTEDAETHYFIGRDGTVTEDDTLHIFALLHCSLPVAKNTTVHTIPRSGNLSYIRSICQFIHSTPHPSNTVILLFMEPFLCHVINLDDTRLRRVVFVQNGNQFEGISEERIVAYYFDLDASSYLTSIHSAAYNIIGRVSPRLDAFSVSLVSEHSEEQNASLIGALISSLIIILSFAAFFLIFCVTADNVSEVRAHYKQLADEWDYRMELREERSSRV